MKPMRKILGFCLLFGAAIFIAPCSETPADPHQILKKYYEAIGGEEKLDAEKTLYFEGKITFLGMKLEGTIKQWDKPPICQRQEVDLRIFKQTEGRNEETSWVLDPNGKVQLRQDEATVKRRKLDELLERRDHLNPESPYFHVTVEGREKVGEADCHIIKIINTINEDIRFQFINVESFLLEKSITKEPDRESRTLYSDYRDVSGIKRPYRFEIENLPVKQKFVIEVAKYESNVEVDQFLFDPPTRDVRDFAFLKGENTENIPFEFIENHLFLPVTINGREKLWCLDTGAQMTAIDTAFALKLDLKAEGKIKGSGAGRTVDLSFVKLPEYSVPGLRFQSQRAVTLEIGEIFKRMYGMDVPGILGYDFLSRLTTKIDYARKTLSFYHPDKFVYKGEGRVVKAPLVNGTFTVPVTVDGKYSGPWSLDLGAGGCSFHYPFAEENGLLVFPGVQRLAGGAGGDFREKEVLFRSIEFAGFTLRNPLIDVPAEMTDGAFRRKEIIGNLGNTLFRHFVLYLDYKQQQVIVEKGEDFGREFPSDRSGLLAVLSENGEIEVYFVSPGTPAEESGFRKGDLIRSIGGKDIASLGGILGVRRLLQQSPGTDLSVTAVREGKQIDLSLKLRDLHHPR
jgi:hypothetical protein